MIFVNQHSAAAAQLAIVASVTGPGRDWPTPTPNQRPFQLTKGIVAALRRPSE